MKQILGIVLAFIALWYGNAGLVMAETRGEPYTEQELLENSTAVFVGEVLETTIFEQYKRTVPSRARVLVSVKGNVKSGGLALIPKHPGKAAYFDAEFGAAAKGRLGVFYVGNKDNPDLLMGFKPLPEMKK